VTGLHAVVVTGAEILRKAAVLNTNEPEAMYE
jgi:hypothetical protein